MNEIEKKELLSKEQYLSCLEYLSNQLVGNRKLQVNYYYDTDSFDLYQKGETLRVRQKDEQLKLEYKFNKSIQNNIRTCEEYESALEALPLTIENDALNLQGCRLLGTLITERYDFKINNTVLSLDKNYYLGVTDYEIEMESEDGFTGVDFMQTFGISFEKPITGKYQRFVNLLKSRYG